MPTLSKPLFPVGFEPKPHPSPQAPYDELPWTNAYWCHLQGFTTVGDGLESRFEDKVWATFTPSQKEKFSQDNLKDAREFLLQVQQRWRENEKTYMLGLNKIPGCTAFRNAMTVLVERRDGINDTVWAAMVAKHATPVDALRDLRMKMEKKGQVFDEDKIQVPKSDTYFSSVRTHLARCAFGEDAINPRSSSVMDEYGTALHALFSRTWEAKKTQVVNLIAKRANLPQKFEKHLQDARNHPKAKHLMDASKVLSDWKNIADVTGEIDGAEFKKQEEELTNLWSLVGRSRGSHGEVKRTKPKLHVVCTQEELDAAYQHYLRLHFPEDNTLGALLDGLDSAPEQHEPLLLELGTDLGVQDLLGKTIPELLLLAGLPANSTQFPFAEPGTSSPEGENTAVSKVPIIPEWHQWIGALCIFRSWFTPSLGNKPMPAMLCDEVGLGKTLQLVGSICILIHYMEHQSRGLEIPPLLAAQGKQYFAGLDAPPALPNLVLVTSALSTQWQEEIRRYTQHGAFQVFLYSRTKQSRHEYFKPGGLWDQAITNSKMPHRTIVVVEMPTIAKEAEECLRRTARDKVSTRRAAPQELVPDCGPTIFDKSFLVGVVDEIHNLRNVCSAWEGALVLLDKCTVRVGATATPICTAYNVGDLEMAQYHNIETEPLLQDVLSALRLLRHPPLLGDEGIAQGEIIEKLEKDAAQSWRDQKSVQKFAELVAKKRLASADSEVSETALRELTNTILNDEKRNLLVLVNQDIQVGGRFFPLSGPRQEA